MPVVIDELVVSVEVGNRTGGRAAAPDAADRQAIVEECVERVMEILEQKQER